MRIAALVRIPSLIALVGAASACGGSAAAQNPPPAPKAHAAVPTAAQLNRLPASPNGFVRLPRGPSSVVTNPDARGPCGAPLRQPDMATAHTVIFSSPSHVQVFLFTRRMQQGAAARLLDAVAADMHPGCPDFTSAMPYRYDQMNDFRHAILPPRVGDQSVAYALRARQNHAGEPWGYGTEALVRRGEVLTAIGIFSDRPVDDAFVQGLAVLAAGGGD